MNKKISHYIIAIATFIFGALPATLLGIFPFFGAIIAGIGSLTFDLLIILFFIWSISSLIGVIGLWRAVFFYIDKLTYLFLLSGIFSALTFIIYSIFTDIEIYTLTTIWLIFSPILTAIYHVYRYIYPIKRN